ncbi:MAG TPA: NUDIX hydrolase [Stellaceae bacterium]|nr:NUDIX hydrolase [Stellaceae bacterium]
MKDSTDRLYPDRPFVGCLAVVRRGDRILLAQRSVPPGIGRWGFPGGKQELGETVHRCAERELLEETGIVAEAVRALSVLDSIRRDETGRVKVHFALIAVLLHWRSGEGEPIEDATALGWFTPEKAKALALFPRVEELMALALSEREGG